MSRAAESRASRATVAQDADDASDPYRYGWRYAYETAADGSEKLVQIPLTYEDLLDPQEGDFIVEDTVHHQVIRDLVDALTRHYRDASATAVWSNLKIAFVIPGLTTGPSPDLCVVEGVEDRDRLRKSFRFGDEPGTIRLVIEVASERSYDKDIRDLLEVYAQLGVEEYVVVIPQGLYAAGPFELRGWQLGKATRRLRGLRPDAEGRLHLRATNLVLGTGEDGWGLRMWDAVTGERLRTWAEVADSETEARRAAEAEVERFRARIERG